MTDYRNVLERDLARVGPAPFDFDDVARRRDRKRRNQRIAAGVVGIAVFVAAVWVVTTGLPFDQNQPSVVPGGDVTGSAETGPTAPASVGTVTFDGSTCSIEFTADRIEPGVVAFTMVNATEAPATFDAWQLMEGYTFREFERAVENARAAPGEPRREAFPGEPKITYLASEYSPSNGSGTLVTTMSPGTHAIVCLEGKDILMRPVGVAGPIVVGTEPTQTGPVETGPTGASPDEWDGLGIPPEGTALSAPVKGQPIGRASDYNSYLVVYADGRVLWWNDLRGDGGGDGPGGGDYVLERRLTPEGVDLVRSGAITAADLAPPSVLSGVPESAWADADARPYAPPRYSVCFWANGVDGDPFRPGLMLPAVELLPAPAKALLSGDDPDPLHPGCLIVSTEDARAFYEILSGVGLNPASDLGGVTPGATVGAWLLRGSEDTLGTQVGIYLRPLWPDGEWHEQSLA